MCVCVCFSRSSNWKDFNDATFLQATNAMTIFELWIESVEIVLFPREIFSFIVFVLLLAYRIEADLESAREIEQTHMQKWGCEDLV